jgi:hypothetical protein
MVESDHWNRVYAGAGPDGVSWYRPHLETSLAFIKSADLGRDVPIIDVGGGAFGPAGPEECSGLDVARYDAETLHREFGGNFRRVDSRADSHTTPWGREQEFVYCYCRLERASDGPTS